MPSTRTFGPYSIRFSSFGEYVSCELELPFVGLAITIHLNHRHIPKVTPAIISEEIDE